jgi:hypothetical protein
MLNWCETVQKGRGKVEREKRFKGEEGKREEAKRQ